MKYLSFSLVLFGAALHGLSHEVSLDVNRTACDIGAAVLLSLGGFVSGKFP